MIKKKYNNLLFFAPIASSPADHGGSIRTIRLFEELSSYFSYGKLIGSNFYQTISNDLRETKKTVNFERSKKYAAVRALLSSDHYIRVKQLSSSLVKKLKDEIKLKKPDVIILSYLYCCEVLPFLPHDTKVFIDTHNNDWEWFENLSNNSSNPISKIICCNSIKKTNHYMKVLPGRVGLLHVSYDDLTVYSSKRRDLRHYSAKWLRPP